MQNSGNYGDAWSKEPSGVDNIKRDVATLKDDVSHEAHRMKDQVRDTVKAKGQQLVEMGKKAGHQMEGVHHKMCDYVQKNPTTSVLIALGVGALVARFLLPRR